MTTSGNVATASANAVAAKTVSADRSAGSKGEEEHAGGGFGGMLSDIQNGDSGRTGDKAGSGTVSAEQRAKQEIGARGGIAPDTPAGSAEAARQFLSQIEDALKNIVGDAAEEAVVAEQKPAAGLQPPPPASANELAAALGAAQNAQAHDKAAAFGNASGSGSAEGAAVAKAAHLKPAPGLQDAQARIASVLGRSGGVGGQVGAGREVGAEQAGMQGAAGNIAVNGRSKSGSADAVAQPAASTDNPFEVVETTAEALSEGVLSPRQTLRANVQRQETHFPPVMPQVADVDGVGDATGTAVLEGGQLIPDEFATAGMRPAQQVAERIGAGIAADQAFASHLSNHREAANPKPVLKVLQIQLQPADMGTVTVRMELKNDGLMLHVEASRSETAEMIRNDQDTLSKLLRSAGYAVDATSIRVAEADRSASSQQFGQQSGGQGQSQSSWQSQSGASEQQRHSGRGDAGAGDQTGAQGGQANRNGGNETASGRTSGGLYL